MINIRTGVFETSSSSVHTITVGQGALLFPKRPYFLIEGDDYTEHAVQGSEFGWSTRTYNDPDTKLKYVVTMLIEQISYFLYNYDAKTDIDDLAIVKHINYRLTFGDHGEEFKETLPDDVLESINDWIETFRLFIEEIGRHYNIQGDIALYDDNSDPDWYIDHAGDRYCTFDEFCEDVGGLINFVFNPCVVLHTTNDNGSDYEERLAFDKLSAVDEIKASK